MGVSVVDFTCTVNQDRVIRGVVKEKQRARQAYDSAISRGQTAGLLEQLPSASDVFTTTIGNVPGGATRQSRDNPACLRAIPLPYDQTTLDEAVRHVQGFEADLGGMEIIGPVKAVFQKRKTDMNLEVFVLTDGDIWNQQGLFDVVNREVQASDGATRLFSLGVGRSVSHSLVEGLARAGRGFAQTVGENEKMDRKVMRMLKNVLTPHVSNYTISVKYAKGEVSCLEGDDGFDLVDHMVAAEAAPGSVVGVTETQTREQEDVQNDPICLFDPAADPDDGLGSAILDCSAGIPAVSPPKILQSHFQIPPLFHFNRANIYLLLSSQTEDIPQSIVLHGILELEEGRGWLYDDSLGLKKKYPGHFTDLIQRETVRLGVKFQVGGRWCSFVAVETNSDDDGISLAQKAEAQESREMQRPDLSDDPDAISPIHSSPLHDVILLQAFIGSWALDPEFLDAVGVKKSPLDDLGLESNVRFAEAVGFAGLSSNLDGVATVLALAFLRLKGSAE
ncbi:von willebrand domain containing protein [Diaporthe eres]|nr:von willebrand domain containing protein [Diaporthe eres]